MTTTAYGSDIETRWADLEDRIRNDARPLPRHRDEPGFFAAIRVINEGKVEGARPVYLTRASVDIEPSTSIAPALLDEGDLGYRLVPIYTRKGMGFVIEVMHENNGRMTEGNVIMGTGYKPTPLPFVTTKAWVVPPSAEYNTLDFLTEVSMAYNDLCKHGDRAHFLSAEAQAERQDEQDLRDLSDLGLDDLFGGEPERIEAPSAAEDIF